MKPNIHPDYHQITIVLTDKTELKTRSTYGKPNDRLQLDVDPTTHPAWTGAGGSHIRETSQVAKFNTRFGKLGFKTKSAASAKEDNA